MIRVFISLFVFVVISAYSFVDLEDSHKMQKLQIQVVHSFEKFKALETIYWKIYKDIDMSRFINPINIEEQKNSGIIRYGNIKRLILISIKLYQS